SVGIKSHLNAVGITATHIDDQYYFDGVSAAGVLQ
nr:hypothetical protein [Tanacetum cinerariifolium]